MQIPDTRQVHFIFLTSGIEEREVFWRDGLDVWETSGEHDVREDESERMLSADEPMVSRGLSGLPLGAGTCMHRSFESTE